MPSASPRASRDFMVGVRGLGIVLLLLVSSLVSARDFPRDAMRGAAIKFDYPAITIGSKQLRMVPSARIYNEHNRLIRRAAMPGKAQVMYQLDHRGNVRNLWLLTPEEVKALGPAPMR
ncbi:MAG: hypothetical protein FJY37_02075 [Betaproteobacteria bacterium]|nr:hypothetical protein [Betaproteobacteria bacterium]